MEDAGIFLWSFGMWIFWPFATFYGHWECFPRFGVLREEKSGNPVLQRSLTATMVLAHRGVAPEKKFRWFGAACLRPIRLRETCRVSARSRFAPAFAGTGIARKLGVS
jgi:hypothetical protein